MGQTQVVKMRAHRRVALPFPVRIRVEGVEGFADCSGTNISSGGVFVSTEHPYPVGTSLHLEMSLPAQDQAVHASGPVVRCVPIYDASEGAAGMGIQFSENSRIDWNIIEKLIKASL